jgi:hypothetical protein
MHRCPLAATVAVMSTRPAWRRLTNRTGLSVVDGLVALGLCGLGVTELAFTTSRFANGPLALVLTLASTLPLGWRRRAPLPTAAAVALAVGAQGLLQQKSPGATYVAACWRPTRLPPTARTCWHVSPGWC